MRVVTANSLVASANGGACGVTPMLRNDLRFFNKIHASSGIDGPLFWHRCMPNVYLRNGNRERRMASAVKAKWLFGGDDKDMDASIERSEAANEDILIFFFQLDLETRIQYALNLEQYEAAKQLRDKLAEVETEIIKQQESKRGSSKSEAQDKAINILRLRADMQKAIENENYNLAADLRDEISKLEADSLVASAKALAYENVQYAFRLGQKVHHKVFGYQGVICGMDPVCCESSSWMELAKVDRLLQGPNQPFYQVLVDVHADPNLLVAYVPEESLLASEEREMVLRKSSVMINISSGIRK
ncbi:hypothetical protein ACMD2_06805 [Ananas comosus]|uniref:UVR domain-containing protein n=1 Tax=Ananas comosus TaxID=4615 RepID=A0A199VQT4_ANACO|nr:hypothetical protein ACMD2_06805 [Ananas comosus]